METKTLHLVGMTHRNYPRLGKGALLDQSDMLVFRDDAGHPWTIEFTYNDGESEAVATVRQESTNYDLVPLVKDLTCEIRFRPEYGGWTVGRQTSDGLEANNPIFAYSEYGNDYDFKTGGYRIIPQFREMKNHLNHPIWIFRGQSGTGKATIAHETGRNALVLKEHDPIPADLSAYDVIVIDDDLAIDAKDIISRFPSGVTPITVDFSKINELD